MALPKQMTFLAIASLSGATVWFAVQAISGTDNFGDAINPIYFIVLYVVAFLIGMTMKSQRWSNGIPVGMSLVLTQIVCYLIYPNVDWTLSNVFPIAAAILLIFIAPAVVFTCIGCRLRCGRN
jgi:hypothetical protein